MPKSALITITLARKSIACGSIAENSVKYGTGALHIEATRISATDSTKHPCVRSTPGNTNLSAYRPTSRWPANLVVQHTPRCTSNVCDTTCAVTDIDAQDPVNAPGNQFFLNLPSDGSNALPDELVAYLRRMVTIEGGSCVVIRDLEESDLSNFPSDYHHAAIVRGEPTPEQAADLLRTLRPGGHLFVAAPEHRPTGHVGACRIEDVGFEIRDCILWVRGAGHVHYVPKAATAEREAGLRHLPEKMFAASGGAQNALAAAEEEGVGDEAEYGGEGDLGFNRITKRRNSHPCLHPDALVLTEYGYRPISEMSVGDKVYSADGRFHPVEHVSHHPYTSPDLFEIQVYGTNYSTLASDNHPFLIWRPTRSGRRVVGGEVAWLPADQIREGDYTMTPDLAEPECAESHDLDWWFVFGLWVAEGVAQRAGHGKSVYPSFTLHADETSLVDRIRSVFKHVSVGVYPKPPSKAVQVMAFDPEAGARFVELAGRGASTKCLDPSVWTLPRRVRQAILEGFLAGDGGRVRSYWQAKTVSPDLSSQLRLLASSVGFKVSLYVHPPTEGAGIGSRKFQRMLPVHQLHLYDIDGKHGVPGSRKPSRPTSVVHDGVQYTLAYVKKVNRVPYKGEVWNLSVEGSPTFQVAVGMSHNTVKPKALMARLLRTVPSDRGPVLDPFMGSGTTMLACLETGHDGIGIEREAEYLEIADARVRHWNTAVAAWDAATIESDHVPAVGDDADTSIEDLLGL
jgi:hypothetical protein